MQSQAEIFNIIEGWKSKCPQDWFISPTNTLKKEYAALLDQFVTEKFGGVYSTTTLDLALVWILLSQDHKAALAAMEADFKRKLAEESWKKRVKEVQGWVNANPNFAQTDEAIGVIKDFFAQHPEAGIAEWSDFCEAHPDDPRLWRQVRPLDLVALVRGTKGKDKMEYDAKIAKLKATYGAQRIDAAFAEIKDSFNKRQNLETWRESPTEREQRYQKEAEDAKTRKAEQDKKAEAKAQWEAEMLAKGFQGQTHAASFRGREKLADIIVYKPDSTVDWKQTLASRQAWIDNYQGKNPAVVNPNAV